MISGRIKGSKGGRGRSLAGSDGGSDAVVRSVATFPLVVNRIAARGGQPGVSGPNFHDQWKAASQHRLERPELSWTFRSAGKSGLKASPTRLDVVGRVVPAADGDFQR